MSEASFICVRCAAVNPTCCRMDPAASAKCFPLSSAERDRLLPYAETLGVVPAETEENTPEFLGLMRILFPDRRAALAKAFPEGEPHLRLPLDDAGNCLFLQEDGCFLPRDARPWYCQLFPIWVRKDYFDRFAPESCLLTHEASRLADVFAALGLTRERAKEMYRALCHDWGMENNDD
ncbi:zinc/iron-chelating domain-containing protein [Desulfovibrio sp. OttesenSCG-928-O18]|nr:zinc/iron-chelating domain-containing protein [Desulfovibrio sp. OttesenSCG-928-O18]